MGTVQKLAENLKEGLQVAPSKLRQTVINKLAVGVMIEAQTPNTSELASTRLCANASVEIVFRP